MAWIPALRPALSCGVVASCLWLLGWRSWMAVPRGAGDAALLTLYGAVAAGLTLFLLNLAWQAAWLRRHDPARREQALWSLDSFLVTGGAAGLALIILLRPFWFGDFRQAAAFTALQLAVLLGARGAGRFGARMARSRAFLPALLFLAALPAAAAALDRDPEAAFAPAAVTPADRRADPVFLIGFDGADWRILDPLIAAGRLPNFQRLKEQGSYAPLRSEIAPNQPFANSASRGMRTPVLWETIATGRRPRHHGVWDFGVTEVPGLQRPLPLRAPRLPGLKVRAVSSLSGEAPRLWEILDAFALPALVVGWVDSWPALPAASTVQISDRAHWAPALTTWPSELAAETAAPRFAGLEGAERERAELAAYGAVVKEVLGLDLDLDYRSYPPQDRRYLENDLLFHAGMDLSRDAYYAAVAERLLEDFRRAGTALPQLSCCYFPSTDSAQHLFWKYFEPQHFTGVPEDAVRRFQDVIPRVYEHADRILGRLLRYADERTTVVVLSDHGGEAWRELEGGFARIGAAGYHQNYSGSHGLHGILAVIGPQVRQGHAAGERSIYDVAPLVLQLCGLPAAQDLPGAAPLDFFEPPFPPRPSGAAPSSYGPRRLPDLSVLGGSAGDEEYFQRLAALGYGG